MDIGTSILLVFILTIAICFSFRKSCEKFLNLITSLEKKNWYDKTQQKQGIVLNNETKKVEAVNGLKLPFN